MDLGKVSIKFNLPFLPQRPRRTVNSGMEVPHALPSFTPYVDESVQPQMM